MDPSQNFHIGDWAVIKSGESFYFGKIIGPRLYGDWEIQLFPPLEFSLFSVTHWTMISSDRIIPIQQIPQEELGIYLSRMNSPWANSLAKVLRDEKS